MQHHLATLGILISLAPLIGGLIAGIFGKQIGRAGAHWVTILFMLASFILACIIFKIVILDNATPFDGTIYTWGISGSFTFNIGFLIDKLTAMMLLVVTFVSTLVHVYSIGYMADDDGYQRFFSYMSVFTFAMIMLVLANNFLQLFFGWEGVGLVSYLLIGFWYHKESANFGSLKAFIANRIGDFGFLLGIAAILDNFGSISYARVFAMAPSFAHTTIQIIPGMHWSLITVICILLFIGAMGKSAQVPLHVWLPESMEGPTPISALIHAATMVTAGVFMMARMSPLFELSQTALSMVLIIGATGALFTGLVGIVQQDIKRVVAYSTLSQLGYMIAATGASAFAAGMFQMFTHACFKALLFLAAGSVIIAMRHEQDMRKMGGLWRYMPITYVTFLIGALSLSAIPPFAGFYSKDAIIEVMHLSTIPGATYGYYCVLLGAFVTALYIFRAFFYTFHGKERFDEHTRKSLKESPWVVWLPLVILAVPATVIGAILVRPLLFGAHGGLLGSGVVVLPKYDVLAELGRHFPGVFGSVLHAFVTAPFWLAVAGIFTAWLCYVKVPALPGILAVRFSWIYNILHNKYGFDDFNQVFLVRGTRKLANQLYLVSDLKLIDGLMVNGSAYLVNKIAKLTSKLQTGYMYHYALAMVAGLLGFLLWLLI